METYIQSTLKKTISRWVDLFFQGELELTHKSRRIIGAVLKIKNYVHPELSQGGFGFSLGVDHGGIVVQWLTPHSRRLLYLLSLCWFRSPLGETPVPPEILVHNKDLTDSWRGKTNLLSRPKTFTAITISKATSICYYNILMIRVFFYCSFSIHHIISSREWISSVSVKRVERTGSSTCSWLSLS